MKQFKFSIHGNTYTVDVQDIEDNMARIEVNGTVYDVEIERKTTTPKTPTLVRPAMKTKAEPVISRKEGGSSHGIVAPLPGNILSVSVAKGDIVEKGQLLMVMEAMKMENKVLADRAGVVEKLHVAQDDVVLQGDVLIEIV